MQVYRSVFFVFNSTMFDTCCFGYKRRLLFCFEEMINFIFFIYLIICIFLNSNLFLCQLFIYNFLHQNPTLSYRYECFPAQKMAEDRDLSCFCQTLLEDCQHTLHSVDDIDSCPLVSGVCRGVRVSVGGKVFRIFEIFFKLPENVPFHTVRLFGNTRLQWAD